MQLFSRSALMVSVAAAGLLAAAFPSYVCSGSALAKANAPQVLASGDGIGGFWSTSPDSDGLGFALGSLGIVAALLAGGTAMVRQRLSAQAAAALEAEVNLGMATETETVLVVMLGEIESEVALAYRR